MARAKQEVSHSGLTTPCRVQALPPAEATTWITALLSDLHCSWWIYFKLLLLQCLKPLPLDDHCFCFCRNRSKIVSAPIISIFLRFIATIFIYVYHPCSPMHPWNKLQSHQTKLLLIFSFCGFCCFVVFVVFVVVNVSVTNVWQMINHEFYHGVQMENISKYNVGGHRHWQSQMCVGENISKYNYK